MTGPELEQALKRQGGFEWRRYMRRKEGFIASALEANFKAGKVVTRREAQGWWFERLESSMRKREGDE